MQSRFGSSVTVLDVNVDGVDDILIGSPAFWNKSPLDYNVSTVNLHYLKLR
jgi:hypothetical protein